MIPVSYQIQVFCRTSNKEIPNLSEHSEKELNHLVEERHSEKTKNQQNGQYQPFEVSNAQRLF